MLGIASRSVGQARMNAIHPYGVCAESSSQGVMTVRRMYGRFYEITPDAPQQVRDEIYSYTPVV
jgi:hypothetical protein